MRREDDLRRLVADRRDEHVELRARELAVSVLVQTLEQLRRLNF